MMLRFPSVICTLYTVFFSYYRIPSKTLFTEKVSHEGNDADLRRGCLLSGSDFNPRSHEGNDGYVPSEYAPFINFNPRSHEGNDIRFKRVLHFIQISIHVPTRGTTEYRLSHSPIYKISIHVPTRGTTE